jgi:hypothetical protein
MCVAGSYHFTFYNMKFLDRMTYMIYEHNKFGLVPARTYLLPSPPIVSHFGFPVHAKFMYI